MKNTILRTFVVPCAVVMASSSGTSAAVLYGNNFNANDGGFTVANSTPVPEGPWIYGAGSGSWAANGSQNVGAPTYSTLLSPLITVPASGMPVTLGFNHRYNFEYDGPGGQRWDGGQVWLSVNGGAPSLVPGTSFTQNGYTGILDPGTSGGVTPPWNGQEGFNSASAGYANGDFITSMAELGSFNAGDSIQVQFMGGWDWFGTPNTPPNPGWQITGVEITQVPEPSQLAMGGMTLLLGGWVAIKRWRQRQ